MNGPEVGITSKAKLEGVDGVAVGSSGTLLAWQDDGEIFVFSDEAANEGLSAVSTGLLGAPGLALESGGGLFAGVRSGAGLALITKLDPETGDVLCGQLDGEASTAVAVNAVDVPGNGVDEQNDVYVTNVAGNSGAQQTTVTQLAPATGCGGTIQRLSHAGLTDGRGVAVDEQTGAVFVTDASSADVDVFELEEPGPPTIEETSVGSATTPVLDARRLSARIDPRGSDTHYSFEYGTGSCAAAPSSCTTTATTDLGGAFGEQEVNLELQGLEPATYHYRVVAENSFGHAHSGAIYSPERTFTILAVPNGLPDGRSWEMVSPPDKHGAPLEGLPREGGLILASEDGNALTYFANGAISEGVQGNRSFEPQQVLASRSRSEWVSQDIATPNTRAAGANFSGAPEYQFFSPDLSLALVEPFSSEPPLASGVSGESVYLRADQPLAPEAEEQESYAQAESEVQEHGVTPGFLPLVGDANAPEAHTPLSVEFRGATADLKHVVVFSSAALTAPAGGGGLYEWSQGGALRPVSVLPDGESTSASSVALGYYRVRAHAISSDGSRVIWTASQTTRAHLYMRDLAAETTIQVDKAQQGLPEPLGAARFETASSDGSRVFFTDDQELVKGASGETARNLTDLYACELTGASNGETCNLRDLTIPVHTGEHAAVQGARARDKRRRLAGVPRRPGGARRKRKPWRRKGAARAGQPVSAALRRPRMEDEVYRGAVWRRRPGLGSGPERVG